jgi:hypothetical protein
MAQTISVSLYTLRITERRQKDPLPVGEFDGKSDLFSIIHEALSEHQGNEPGIKETTRRIYVTNDLARKGRTLDGRVEVGDSGYTASLKDIATGKENYRQKTTDARLLPLYFRFWIPKKQPYGFVAFQHFGDAGCKTAIESIISSNFQQKHPEYTFAMRQRIPSDYADEVLTTGGIKEFRFIQFGVNKDIADMYGGASVPPGTANVEVRIIAKRKSTLNSTKMIMDAIKNRQLSARGFELDNFQCNDFRITVNVKGKDRVLRVGEFLKMNSRIEVTDIVDIGRDGHPSRESIADACEALIREVAEDMDIVA